MNRTPLAAQVVVCAVMSATALGAGGCALKLQLVDASVRKPSNVAVYSPSTRTAASPSRI